MKNNIETSKVNAYKSVIKNKTKGNHKNKSKLIAKSYVTKNNNDSNVKNNKDNVILKQDLIGHKIKNKKQEKYSENILEKSISNNNISNKKLITNNNKDINTNCLNNKMETYISTISNSGNTKIVNINYNELLYNSNKCNISSKVIDINSESIKKLAENLIIIDINKLDFVSRSQLNIKNNNSFISESIKNINLIYKWSNDIKIFLKEKFLNYLYKNINSNNIEEQNNILNSISKIKQENYTILNEHISDSSYYHKCFKPFIDKCFKKLKSNSLDIKSKTILIIFINFIKFNNINKFDAYNTINNIKSSNNLIYMLDKANTNLNNTIKDNSDEFNKNIINALNINDVINLSTFIKSNQLISKVNNKECIFNIINYIYNCLDIILFKFNYENIIKSNKDLYTTVEYINLVLKMIELLIEKIKMFINNNQYNLDRINIILDNNLLSKTINNKSESLVINEFQELFLKIFNSNDSINKLSDAYILYTNIFNFVKQIFDMNPINTLNISNNENNIINKNNKNSNNNKLNFKNKNTIKKLYNNSLIIKDINETQILSDCKSSISSNNINNNSILSNKSNNWSLKTIIIKSSTNKSKKDPFCNKDIKKDISNKEYLYTNSNAELKIEKTKKKVTSQNNFKSSLKKKINKSNTSTDKNLFNLNNITDINNSYIDKINVPIESKSPNCKLNNNYKNKNKVFDNLTDRTTINKSYYKNTNIVKNDNNISNYDTINNINCAIKELEDDNDVNSLCDERDKCNIHLANIKVNNNINNNKFLENIIKRPKFSSYLGSQDYKKNDATEVSSLILDSKLESSENKISNVKDLVKSKKHSLINIKDAKLTKIFKPNIINKTPSLNNNEIIYNNSNKDLENNFSSNYKRNIKSNKNKNKNKNNTISSSAIGIEEDLYSKNLINCQKSAESNKTKLIGNIKLKIYI